MNAAEPKYSALTGARLGVRRNLDTDKFEAHEIQKSKSLSNRKLEAMFVEFVSELQEKVSENTNVLVVIRTELRRNGVIFEFNAMCRKGV